MGDEITLAQEWPIAILRRYARRDVARLCPEHVKAPDLSSAPLILARRAS